MNRDITDQEFEQARKNSDYIKIIRSISKKYIRFGMDHDNADQCGLLGLWYALKYWDEDYKIKCKFTTYLYQVVTHQFMQKCRYTQRNKPLDTLLEHHTANEHSDDNTIAAIDWFDFIKILPPKNKNIIIQRIFCGLTFKEIGKLNGYSKQAAQTNYVKAIKTIKALYQINENRNNML